MLCALLRVWRGVVIGFRNMHYIKDAVLCNGVQNA